MVSARARVHHLLQSESPDGTARVVQAAIVVLIVLNVLAVMAESVASIHERFGGALRAFELFSLGVFVVEYVLRMWAAGEDPRFAGAAGRLRWMVTPFAIIDLVAIVPAFFPVSDLRFLRVLRLLKLSRHSEGLRILGHVFRRRRDELMMALFLVALALLLSSSLMYYAEHEAQPEVFSSIPATMWWGIITLTTIGYGDTFPITQAGRVLAGVVAIVGILVVALPVGILASGFTDELQARRDEKDACPHCGKRRGDPPTF